MTSNKEWHIGDTVTNADIKEVIEWCNARGDCYPKQISYDPTTGAEVWIITLVTIPEPSLEKEKLNKLSENDNGAESARESQSFIITINDTELAFITNRRTQSDLQNVKIAFLENPSTTYSWIDENGTSFTFTSIEQINQVMAVFNEKINVYDKWVYFRDLINAAETVEEVQAIVIDYGINSA